MAAFLEDDPILFPLPLPSSCNDNAKGAGIGEAVSQDFHDACVLAMETGRPLHLVQEDHVEEKEGENGGIVRGAAEDAGATARPRTIAVDKTIVLKKRQHLRILFRRRPRDCGGVNAGNEGRLPHQQQGQGQGATNRVQLVGNKVHSLFLLNNHSQLTLESIELHHTIPNEEAGESPSNHGNHREVGAAISLRYKGQLRMTDCLLRSGVGFCCWLVQKSRLDASDCVLEAPMRSAVVCFGKSECSLRECRVRNSGVHAICARGECRLTLRDCRIVGSSSRAVYAYARASVDMANCRVSNTINPSRAAIEISSSSALNASEAGDAGSGAAATGSGKASTLRIHNCTIVDNAGAGICLRGPVTLLGGHDDNLLERNSGGNIVRRKLVDGDCSASDGAAAVRRDTPGTSFRQGDWWCPKCPLYVLLDRQVSCPKCGSPKMSGRDLSAPEIRLCNQGRMISVAPKQTPNAPTGGLEGLKNSCPPQRRWSYDGDGKGWVRYDDDSQRRLEEAYRRYHDPASGRNGDPPSSSTANANNRNPVVFIANGKYQVNVSTMEQINASSHFMRLVHRGGVEQ